MNSDDRRTVPTRRWIVSALLLTAIAGCGSNEFDIDAEHALILASRGEIRHLVITSRDESYDVTCRNSGDCPDTIYLLRANPRCRILNDAKREVEVMSFTRDEVYVVSNYTHPDAGSPMKRTIVDSLGELHLGDPL